MENQDSFEVDYGEYVYDDKITDKDNCKNPSGQSKSKRKTIEDQYDEDNYCLARNSNGETDSNSDAKSIKSKSIVSLQNEVETSATIMNDFWSKNRLIAIFVGLAVVIVILFSVCIYQATTTSDTSAKKAPSTSKPIGRTEIGKPIIKLVNSSDDEPIVSDVISVVSNQIYNVTVEIMGLIQGLVDDYVNVTIDGEEFGTCKISGSATSCTWNTCTELNKKEILTKSSKLFVKLHFNSTDRKQGYCNEPDQGGHELARITLTPQVQFVTQYGSWEYYKVKTAGKMTSANIKKACERNNLMTTCVGSKSCHLSNSECSVTALTACDRPMEDLSRQICNKDPRYCNAFAGVFSFTARGSLGRISTSWPVSGNSYNDQWALCSNPIEWTCDNGDKIQITRSCNGYSDCSDGSDEKNCATLLAEFDSWEYYKVKTSGQMTSANIKKTCERNNLINTCVGSHSCQYSNSECTITALTECSTPMVMLSRHICQGNDPQYCKKLDGVFSYTSEYACGVIGTSHCAPGNVYYDQWALCAKPIEWTCDNGEKIHITRSCNGHKDCSDGSDEKHCDKFIAKFGSWGYYKVKTSGKMTSANIKATCERHNLVNTCVGFHSCQYTNSDCTVTALTGCEKPMVALSQQICNGQNPNVCNKLNGVFAYTYGTSCGTIKGAWCADGNVNFNQWALCAKPIEWKCDNGEKINITRECNGFPDCSDGSDEKGCVSFVADFGNWNYYKVKTSGKMMSTNVKETCEFHNLVTPCVGSDSCKYTDAGCNVTSLSGCSYPMKLFSQSICNGVETRLCSRLNGIFAYMGNRNYYSGSSYGTIDGNVAIGSNNYNQWALCARPKEKGIDSINTRKNVPIQNHIDIPNDVLEEYSNFSIRENRTAVLTLDEILDDFTPLPPAGVGMEEDEINWDQFLNPNPTNLTSMNEENTFKLSKP